MPLDMKLNSVSNIGDPPSFPSPLFTQATLKKYQSERKSKADSIERCQSQLKKLRRKSQGSRHPNKYGDREMQVTPKSPNIH